MIVINWEDASNFTWNDLNYFTWRDLTLGKLELLEKINQDEEVPREIVDKVYQLCNEILKDIPNFSTSLPTDRKKFKLKNITELLNTFIIYYTAYDILVPENTKAKALDIFIQTLNYFR